VCFWEVACLRSGGMLASSSELESRDVAKTGPPPSVCALRCLATSLRMM
jgi:hypothetical protein